MTVAAAVSGAEAATVTAGGPGRGRGPRAFKLTALRLTGTVTEAGTVTIMAPGRGAPWP